MHQHEAAGGGDILGIGQDLVGRILGRGAFVDVLDDHAAADDDAAIAKRHQAHRADGLQRGEIGDRLRRLVIVRGVHAEHLADVVEGGLGAAGVRGGDAVRIAAAAGGETDREEDCRKEKGTHGACPSGSWVLKGMGRRRLGRLPVSIKRKNGLAAALDSVRVGADDLAAGPGAQGPQVGRLIVSLMKWTEPSAKATFTPPEWKLLGAIWPEEFDRRRRNRTLRVRGQGVAVVVGDHQAAVILLAAGR